MSTIARDLMQTEIQALAPDTPLLSVHRLFVDEQISGAPVISDDGQVLGVVSTSDLIRAITDERDAGANTAAYFRDDLDFSSAPGLPGDFQDQLAQLSASEVMVADVIAVSPEMPATEVARTLRDHRIHRVLVVEEGALVGLISTFDLLDLVVKGAQ